jgi:hypothetical protein
MSLPDRMKATELAEHGFEIEPDNPNRAKHKRFVSFRHRCTKCAYFAKQTLNGVCKPCLRDAAASLGATGAAKGGRARANILTPDERSEIARLAVQERWRRAGKIPSEPAPHDSPQEQAIEPDEVIDSEPMTSETAGQLPFALFSGTLTIGKLQIPCHVLNDGKRVLHQRAMVAALGMSRGGSSKGGGDRLAHFVNGKAVSEYVPKDLRLVTTKPLVFKTTSGATAYGYEATVLAELCEAVLSAWQDGKLQEQQEHIARQCVILMRGFARVGIIALVDEATGYDKVKKQRDLQIKLQAFIADELQEWARMFPQEFWLELARLEGIHYSPRNRPLRWGKYVMMFVYDAIDGDVGKELRKKNPNPHFLKNHHQWLKKFGRDRVHVQIEKVVTIMKLCNDMDDFRSKFAKVFRKGPLQLTFDDINWQTS